MFYLGLFFFGEKRCLFISDLAMLAIRSSEEESTENEDMDTSESNWCWFYLAECGVWHMFEVDSSLQRFQTRGI